jgi:hypothetical protein
MEGEAHLRYVERNRFRTDRKTTKCVAAGANLVREFVPRDFGWRSDRATTDQEGCLSDELCDASYNNTGLII